MSSLEVIVMQRAAEVRANTVAPLDVAELRSVVADLRDIHGTRLIATLCRVAPATVNNWARGKSSPREPVTWLRLAYLHGATTEVGKQTHFTVGGWFSKPHPEIEEALGSRQTPWQLLVDYSIERTGPVVLAAAKRFAYPRD